LEGSQAMSNQTTTPAEDGIPVERDAQDRGGKPLLQADSSEQERCKTRRHFLGRSAKKLAYISPVVLLLRPRPACASRIYS